MGMTNMLTLAVYLDPVPGGVAPELHLKEGSSSVEADLFILDAVSDHVNQPKERSGKITKYCVHVF